MYGINNIGAYTPYPISPKNRYEEPIAKTKENKKAVPKTDTISNQSGKKVIASEVMKEDSLKTWEQEVQDCIQKLQNKLSGIDINIFDFSSKEQLSKYAIKLGNGQHIIISKEFLEGMASDQKLFDEGLSFLKEMMKKMDELAETLKSQGLKTSNMGIVINDNGKGSLWMTKPELDEDFVKKLMEQLQDKTITDLNKDYGKKVSEIKTSTGAVKWVYVRKLSYSAASNLARLAKLNGVAEVKSFMGGVRAKLNMVKRDKDMNPNQIKQAVAQMEGVIRRARTKVKNLEDENIIKGRGRTAAKRKQMEVAEEHAKELKRRRILRRSREYGQISDKFPVSPDKYDYERELEREENCSIISGYGDNSTATDAGSVSGGGISPVPMDMSMPSGGGVSMGLAEVVQVINIIQ